MDKYYQHHHVAIYFQYDLYAKTIRPDFNEPNFQTELREKKLVDNNKPFGFRIYKKEDTYASCLTANS